MSTVNSLRTGGLALLMLVLAAGCGTSATGIGDAGTVDSWAVTVDGIATTSTGDESAPGAVHSEIASVELTITNGGTEAAAFDSWAVTLTDADGRTHSSNLVSGDGSLFSEDVEPDGSATGEARVDVPSGTDIAEVVVEDVPSGDEALVIDVK